MSKVEVEDVLSSIRRLVSDDVRVLSQASKTSAVPRLLLTDALRVYPAPPAPSKPAHAVLVLSNPVRPPAAVPNPVASEPAGAPLSASAPLLPQRRLHLVTPQDAPKAQVASASTQGASEVARRLAEIEALLNAQDHSSFETEAPPSRSGPAQMSWDRGDSAEAPFIDADLEPAPAVSASIHWAAPVGTLPAADEDLVTSAPMPEPAFAPTGSRLSATDEDILRTLVREVMLEELSGATGERVTRNLRKIVRAEIARALSARGMA